jgi:hypothetical protein
VSYVLQLVDPSRPTKAFVYRVGKAAGTLTSTVRITVPPAMRARSAAAGRHRPGRQRRDADTDDPPAVTVQVNE